MMDYQFLYKHDFTLDYLFAIDLLLVLFTFIVSYALKRFWDKRFLAQAEEFASATKNKVRQRFIISYRYISYPLYLTILLTIFYIGSTIAQLDTKIILIFTQFSIIWLSLRLITIVSGNRSPKLIVIIIGCILLLDIFNLTEVTIVSLENLSIELGSFKLSALLLVKAIITIIVSLWVISLISRLSRRIVINFKSLNSSSRHIITVIIDAVLYFFLFLILLKLTGFNIATIAVVGSAVGIGIGFGLQKITSNFIAGIILLFEKSIKEGDIVELSNNPGDVGFVKKMGIRYTLINTFDNKEIMMPNEDFVTHKVTNWTFSDREIRIRINIGVSYESDLNLVKKLILESAHENQHILVTRKPTCFLHEFGDSSVNFILHAWVDNVNLVEHEAKSDILFSIWNKFKENNITIPFPQRDLHIKLPQSSGI